MSRYKYQDVMKDGNGRVIADGIIKVYLTGTSTLASFYTLSSGGTAASSVTSDDDGSYYFYVDTDDYAITQQFDITLSKTGFTAKTISTLNIFPPIFDIRFGTLTLGASVTSTVVTNTWVTAACRIFLSPTSATAVADVVGTGVYVSTKTVATSFTITHPNTADADKTFDYLLIRA